MGTRRTARYALVARPTIRVDWPTDPAVASPEAKAELLDISRGGAKLSLGVALRIGARLTLHFDELAVAMPGTVLWTRPEQDDRWWTACAFDPPLEGDVLRRMMAAGYLERRRDPREGVEIPATARWQTGEQAPVGIRDFSTGGLCLSSPHAAVRGQRLLLHLGDADDAKTSAVVETQWCINFEAGHLVGCSFLHRDGLAAVRRMAASHRGLSANGSPTLAARARLRARLDRLKLLWKNFAEWADRER